MDNFAGRISLNPFGALDPSAKEKASDYSDFICPNHNNFSGYHTGADLEVTVSERADNISVPVYAIADGTVREAKAVSGYGGLIVIQSKIDDQDYTIYYGHIDLTSTSLKTGDKITAGQKLANLGSGCSAANGNNRKHLHLGIHKGTTIDVKGYVPTTNELSNWIDPEIVLNK